jgi:hypothetical protein
MFCASYRKALSEAVLLGDRVHGEIESHLATCAGCREAFSEEQTLLQRIDGGLSSLVISQEPGSLVPGVRARIADGTVSRSVWRPVLVYATAVFAISVAAISFSVRSKVPPLKFDSSIAGASSAVESPTASPQVESVRPYERSSRDRLVVTGKQTSPDARAARNNEPEVLISAEDRLGLQRYVASLRTVARRNAATLEDGTGPEIKPLEIAELDLKQLSIEPLESGDSN